MFEKHFDTWTEFVDYAENAPSEMPDQERASRFNPLDNYQSFTKAKDWQDVLRLAKEGWPEGLKKTKELSAIMFNHVSQMIERVDVNHDIEGHAIDVARFVDGEPESWLKFENVIEESQNGHKLIKISFNCVVSSGISTEVIIRKGSAIVSLIELLEYAGYRVELTLFEAVAASYTTDKRVDMLYSVKLKGFDQNSDMANISYALAHPSVSRALMFSIAETAPKEVRDICGVKFRGSYGRPADIPNELKGDIHIGHSRWGESQWNSTQATEKWIIEQLAKQGVHLKKELEPNENKEKDNSKDPLDLPDF